MLAPAKTVEQMNRIIFNDYVNATLAALFVAVVVAMLVFGVIYIRKALGTSNVTAVEVGGGRSREQAVPDILRMKEWTVRAARLMVGIPDYDTYVRHCALRPSRQAGDDLRGVLHRAAERPLRRRQRGRMFRCC